MADLTGDALDARGKELRIANFEKLTAEEKRKAVAKAEGDLAAKKDADAVRSAINNGTAFPLSEYLDRPGLLGTDAGTIAGAYHGAEADTVISLTDAKNRITEWHKSEAVTDGHGIPDESDQE